MRPTFWPLMSKPLNPYLRLDLTHASPGALVRSTVRMGLYWLCATVLIWASQQPLTEWRFRTVLCFFAASSVIAPSLGYLSLLLRGGGNDTYLPNHSSSASLAHTLFLTGIIFVEILVILLTAVSVQRLLF